MNSIRLWYRQPVDPKATWESMALPVGNGQVGALVPGEVERERIVFNEKSLWTGGPRSRDGYSFGWRRGGAENLHKVRDLLRVGNQPEALKLAQRALAGDPDGFGDYLPFGAITLEFFGHTSPEEYERSLDLERGVVVVRYRQGGVCFTREIFCSYPAQVIAIRLTADRPEALNVRVGLESMRPHEAECDAMPRVGGERADAFLRLAGMLEENRMVYVARMGVNHVGGTLECEGEHLQLRGVTEAVLLLACSTDYRGKPPYYNRGRPHLRVAAMLREALMQPWSDLLGRHQKDYAALFGRVSLTLGRHESPELPTDELLRQYAGGRQNGLEELMFHYGRYLLIASSRPGSLPANLRGVWNPENKPDQSCCYRFDVKLEMNYWPTGPANLLECGDPLIQYLRALREPGNLVAQKHYDIGRGWVINTSSNIFGYAGPDGEYNGGWSPASNAFVCQNVWDLFRFSDDHATLVQIYPLLKGASEFWLDFLFADQNGALISAPSFAPANGEGTVGCAMDQQLVYDLFCHTVMATELLNRDPTLRGNIQRVLPRLSTGLRAMRRGAPGGVDHPSWHLSHLVGVYPGRGILRAGADYKEEARASLQYPDDDTTGWSRAFQACLWARLGDGAHAHRMLRGQLESCTCPNLLNARPTFQIDGNFGYVAGVCEMLLQSWDDCAELLPALPPDWTSGSFSGLLARGGFEVSAQWEDSRVRKATFLSHHGNLLRLRLASPARLESGGPAVRLEPDASGLVEFPTAAGESYTLIME